MKRFPGIEWKAADRDTPANMMNKGAWPARVLKRARVLPLLDQKWRVSDITGANGAYPATIRRLGYCYLEGGRAVALEERARPGADRLLDKRQEAEMVAMVCGASPS